MPEMGRGMRRAVGYQHMCEDERSWQDRYWAHEACIQADNDKAVRISWTVVMKLKEKEEFQHQSSAVLCSQRSRALGQKETPYTLQSIAPPPFASQEPGSSYSSHRWGVFMEVVQGKQPTVSSCAPFAGLHQRAPPFCKN
jgi:hypothetical protein